MNQLLGAHMSISDGFYKAIIKAAELETNCLQIFTKSNRQWEAKPINPKDIVLFKQHIKQHNIKQVIAHASYLINVASDNLVVAQKSIEALIVELERCASLEIKSLVLHPGNNKSVIKGDAVRQIAKNINIALSKSNTTNILLENMAGQGASVAQTIEEIAEIYNLIEQQDRVGVCFDTCHAFAAGYDLNNNYEEIWKQFDSIIGLNKLKAIHLNDSKKPLGSKIDRHENIGQGYIALDTFEKIMNDSRFIDIVKILETPINKNAIEYRSDLNKLLALVKTY